MTDDLELRLRDSFAAAQLPSAPPSLARTLAELSIEGDYTRRKRRPWVLVTAGVVLILVAGYLQIVLLLGNAASAPNQPPPLTPIATPSPSPSPSPDALQGLHVYSVGELQAAMTGPNRPAGATALAGFWTDRSFGHSCVPRQVS